MSAALAFPLDGDWKNPAFVHRWKLRRKIEKKWGSSYAPLLDGVPLAASPANQLITPQMWEVMTWENESLLDSLRRQERMGKVTPIRPKQKRKRLHQHLTTLIALAGANEAQEWILAPVASRAVPAKLETSKAMYLGGLEKKANRLLACGLLGGEVRCRDAGHRFRVGYECGNRYCPECGPRAARRLFARQAEKIRFAATCLCLCGSECEECSKAIDEKRLPHWPPPSGVKPAIVCAKLDFTLRNTGQASAELMRSLNLSIKRFFRAIERRLKISRKEYGVIWCDELGANNTNAHAHALYVGPWLPQKKKELSKLWHEITGDSFIVSIKYAQSWGAALYHALKYPAKFVEYSTPQRRAELEIIFHRVRRLHTMAAFYRPEVPPVEKPPARACPMCGSALSEVGPWQSLELLRGKGLRDLAEVEAEVKRAKGLEGLPAP